jgi:hypothetical protein
LLPASRNKPDASATHRNCLTVVDTLFSCQFGVLYQNVKRALGI